MNFELTNLPTLVSIDRICNLIKYSHYASRLTGAVAEFGCYKGGSLEVLARFNPTADIFGIDSFNGLPNTAIEGEFHKEGDFSDVDYISIAGYFKMMYPNVRLLKGFSPTVFEYFDESLFFRMVHIDVDLYQSVLDGLNFFIPRLVIGGVIILDDYSVRSTPGCKKAIEKYFEETEIEVSHREELKYFTTNSSDTHYQYLIIK